MTDLPARIMHACARIVAVNLGRAHGIETVLGAIAATAECVNGQPEIHWLFIGGGAHYRLLKLETERRGFTTVEFRPYQPREILSESLSVADVHIVLLSPALEGLIVPSKVYGIAAAGRPAVFIGALDGEIARLIEQYECGVTIAPGDASALVAALRAMAQDPAYCRRMGKRARAMCEAKFSKSQSIAAWHQLLERIAQSDAITDVPAKQPKAVRSTT